MAFAITKPVKFVRREIESRAVNRGAYPAHHLLRRFKLSAGKPERTQRDAQIRLVTGRRSLELVGTENTSPR